MAKFITFDGQAFRSSMQVVLNQFDAMGKKASAAVTAAMVEFAEYMLATMQRLAPYKTGKLVESGHVTTPRVEGDFIVVEIKWDAPYALMQDKGGIVTPKDFRATPVSGNLYRSSSGRFINRRRVNVAKLFISLRDGVKPIKDVSMRGTYTYGIDYVLARYAVIPGTGFITKVIQTEGKNADRTVGRIAERILSAMMGEAVTPSRGLSGGRTNTSGFQGPRGPGA